MAWEASIIELLRCQEWMPTQRGMYAIELLNVVLRVVNPFGEPRISARYGFNAAFIDRYVESLRESFSGSSVKTRLYDYGPERVNQVDAVLEALGREWYTRRAVITLWDPIDDNSLDYPPCTIAVQFLVRHGRLHLTAMLRSNDAWLAALPDMIALTDIQRSVAESLGLPVGEYTQISASYHLYDIDRAAAIEQFRLANI